MEKSPRDGFVATGDYLGEEWEFRLKAPIFSAIRIGLENPDLDRVGCRFRGLSFGRGKIFLPGGRELRWRRSFLGVFYDHLLEVKGGARLLRVRPSFFRLLSSATQVKVYPAALDMPELPQLLLLSFFLRINVDKRGRRIF